MPWLLLIGGIVGYFVLSLFINKLTGNTGPTMRAGVSQTGFHPGTAPLHGQEWMRESEEAARRHRGR